MDLQREDGHSFQGISSQGAGGGARTGAGGGAGDAVGGGGLFKSSSVTFTSLSLIANCMVCNLFPGVTEL